MSSDGSGSTFEVFDRKTPEDEVQFEINNLKLEMELMRIEMKDRKSEEHKTDEPSFKTSISGLWKLVESSNVEEYLRVHHSSTLFATIFQLADAHLEFHEDVLTMCYQVGSLKHFEKTFEMSTPNVPEGSVTYILENSLKTVHLGVNSGASEEKRFLRDGRLHVVMRNGGVECTRVYEKRALARGEAGDEDGTPLHELKQQLHHLSIQRHGNSNKAQEKMEQFEPHAPLEQQKQMLQELLLSMQADPTFIKNTISGEWQIAPGEPTLHLKIEHNEFVQRSCSKSLVQTFGATDEDGCSVEVENNEVVWKTNGNWKWKYYLEDGKLVECNSTSKTCLVYERTLPDRLSKFCGLWQDVNHPEGYTSIQIANHQFTRTHNNTQYTHTFGVKGDADIVTYEEGGSVVQAVLSADGQVVYRSVYFVEGGLMVYEGGPPGQFGERYVHRRVGEPL